MPDGSIPTAPTARPDVGGTDGDLALLSRLRDTAGLIERMLHDDRRQRYFEALKLKRSGAQSGNVTALFFGEGASALQPEA